MTVDRTAVHILLAIGLFFLMNWIGGHSITSASYFQITYFSRHEEAPAFNVVFRVLTPVVYLILVASLLYAGDLDTYVQNIYMVAVYHVLVRWAYNVVFGRRLLLQWGMQLWIAGVSVGVSYLAYSQILADRARVLPDLNTLANELWIAVLLFLYKLFDHVAVKPGANYARQSIYLRRRYRDLRRLYGSVVERELVEPKLLPFVYAILIYETFNRPAIVQWVERHVLFPLGHAKSLGPLQLQVDKPLSDIEIVRLGLRKIETHYRSCLEEAEASARAYQTMIANSGLEPWADDPHRPALECAAKKCNVRSDYAREVMSVYDFLAESFPADFGEQNRSPTTVDSHTKAQGSTRPR